MRHRTRSVVLVFPVIVLLAGVDAFAARLEPAGKAVENEVLVKLRAGTPAAEMANLERLADAERSQKLATVRSGALWRLRSRSKNANAIARALEKNPNVEYVEPNAILQLDAVPNDPLYGVLWGLKNSGQELGSFAGSDVSAERAWNVTTGSHSVVVAVVDTGIDYTHADLVPNLWKNPGGIGNGACAAGTFGYDAIARTCDPRDGNGHGTHVAGTIGAAGNNNRGVTGVNWNVSIMSLKFLDASGSGTTADAIVAVDFVVEAKKAGTNVRVLNASWGGGSFSRALLDVILEAGEHDILFVAAAGNAASDTSVFPWYPSSYTTPNMISVAATSSRDQLASFSNYGASVVHLSAPGVNILSTIPGGQYTELNGTSMAAPHVSGVAALVLANSPGLPVGQVKSAILDNTDPVPALAGKTVTGGRLNAARAVGAPAIPEFALSVSPALRTIPRGASTTYTVTIAPANGFNTPVALSVRDLPPGVTAAFNPASATTTSTLTLTSASIAEPVTTSDIVVTGTGGGVSRSTTIGLTVTQTDVARACPSFLPPAGYGAFTPSATATGDLNRDGVPDLVAAEVTVNRVVVHLGNGDGTLQAGTQYIVGTAPVALAVRDLNGDGKPDVAVANSGSSSVSVLMGSGDGTLQPVAHYPAGVAPFAVAIGDLDGDGRLDLAVANNGSATVSVLRNLGDGTFAAAAHHAAGSGPFAVAIGDLDRDGILDLAVAAYNAGRVSILRGTGGGAFSAATHYAAGQDPSGIALADFDADGRLDVAASNYSSNDVSVFRGSGDGTLLPPRQYAVGTAPYAIEAADFDHDGLPDLITANYESSNASVLMNAGGGSFRAATHYAAELGATHVATGDFDRDGNVDFVIAGLDASRLTIHRNAGDCDGNCSSFAAAGELATGAAPKAVAAADLDRDGRLDLVTANHGADNVAVSLASGDGTFHAAVVSAAGSDPEGLAIGDVDRDGKTDVVTANGGSNDVSVLRGNGNGTLQAAAVYAAGTAPRAVALGDFNGDGRPDLAVANGGSNDVSILLGNAGGTFQSAVHYGAGTSPRAVTAGDFNGDGKPDLAVASAGSNDVSILRGNGDGTFQTAASVGAGTAPWGIAAGDFNRDGKLDFATVNNGSNDVTVRRGNGDGTFAAAAVYAAGSAPSALTVGDFNQDGRVDLAVSNSASNGLSILFATSAGFAPAVHVASGNAPAAVAAADLNRDGRSDLVTANSSAGTLSILLIACPDLTVTKTHSGDFVQGGRGHQYTITVSNSGRAATAGSVVVTDVVPNGLTAASISGDGWTCSSTRCSRNDVLAGGASFPPVTVSVNVASNAPANVTNVVYVEGGGEANAGNNSAADPTAIIQTRDLVVSVTHAGNFAQGNVGRTYTITGRNIGGLPAFGDVTIAATVPAGLAATALSGSGWTCNLGALSCTRGDALSGGASYPPITLTVNVNADAPPEVTTSATISNGSDDNVANNTAHDPTVIVSGQVCGTFAEPAHAATTAASPQDVAVSDYNGDGKPDLAVANADADTVTIHLGNGDGTFASGLAYATNDYPRNLAAGDFNHDGKKDLAVAQTTGGTMDGTLSVLLGNGDGTFQAAVHHPLTSASDVVVGEFNGDGHPDLAVPMRFERSYAILLGNGDGTFQPPVARRIESVVEAITAGDVNGDGKTDLLMSRINADGGFVVALGNGNGTFGAPISHVGTSITATDVALADFNGDGTPDVVVPNYQNGNVTVSFGNGDGTFVRGGTFATGNVALALVAKDIDADGMADVAVTGFNTGTVTLLFGNGDGTFAPGVNYNSGSSSDGVAVADLNLDGRMDLAVTLRSSAAVVVLAGNCLPPSVVTLTATDAGAAETVQSQTADPGQYTLTRSGSTVRPLTVNLALSGTASNGADYATIGPAITFPAGASSVTIPIVPVDDPQAEGSETVILTLASSPAYVVGSPGSGTVTISDNDDQSAKGFYIVTPCRLIDTRSAVPALAAAATRNVAATGRCGIPPGAIAIALNVTAVSPASAGFLTIFPGPAGSTRPAVSTLNYRTGKTRANNAVIGLGTDGSVNVFNAGSDAVQFIVDVTGYFR